MGRKFLVAFIIFLLFLGFIQPVGGSEDGFKDNRGGTRTGEPLWSDTLDDLSHVYSPDGLVDVEVAGGEARLVAGEDQGYIVSEIIHAEAGYNYNLVYLDAVVPGNSSIEISILNAQKESSVVGYANETVPDFERNACTDLSLTGVGSAQYPEIRIQVNLNANGTERPSLLGWYLYYVPHGEWRDEFLGTSKMEYHQGISLVDDVVEIDGSLEWMMLYPGEYEAYPPVIIPYGKDRTHFDAFYPHTSGTGYQNRVAVECQATRGVAFDDLNGDGHLDLICANHEIDSIPMDSQICWGDGTGAWSPSNTTDLHTPGAFKVEAGDFNGDGELDLAFACTSSKVFLNAGDGQFQYEPDITIDIEYQIIDTGDLNSDGFCDIVFTESSQWDTRIYYGGPDGPDTIADLSYSSHGCSHIEDINGDGFLDLLLGIEGDPGVDIYFGGQDGPSSTPDTRLVAQGGSGWYIDAGDLNGDGYTDIASLTYDTTDDFQVFIYRGSSAGWSSTDRYVLCTSDRRYHFEILDIDLDGYEDIAISGDYRFEVWYGDPSWPSSAGISLDIAEQFSQDLALGVPDHGSGGYGGFMLTEKIPLPAGKRWDILDLTADVPKNTSVHVSVLDGSKGVLKGYNHLEATNIDMSDVPEGCTDIRIRVNLASEFNNTTPTLHGLTVLWQDEMTWREQFYGMAKIANISGLDVRDGELQRAQGTGGPGSGMYLSQAFGPDVPRDSGCFHTLRYTARLGASQSGMVRVIDATTSEVLAGTPLQSGDQEWVLADAFVMRDHPVIRVNVTAQGLDAAGEFALDDLWLNWTGRVNLPPRVESLTVSEPSVLRLQTVTMALEVTDDYDLPGDLMLDVEHRVNGTDTWLKYLVDAPMFNETEEVWIYTIFPKASASVGAYDFRVDIRDRDYGSSDWSEFPNLLEVRNNLPSTPEVHIEPSVPVTSAPLRVEIDVSANDLETPGVTYVYRWYRDGVLFEDETSDILAFYHTSRGENWSVEVTGFDGIDEGLPGKAWVSVVNAPPSVKNALPDPELDEDTYDSDWLDLSTAFSDADGDPLVWSVAEGSENITVDIDPETGKVTITPKADWFGEEEVTFVATDPDMEHASQTVTVIVHSVNDIPVIALVDGVAPTSDTLEYTMKQGETLTITYVIADVEGDGIEASVNTNIVTHDTTSQELIFTATNEDTGILRFSLTVNDMVSPSERVYINFIIVIENVNDPMEEPEITSPDSGSTYKVNQTINLKATCDDPDIQFGQELNYTWESNISGILGYGESLTAKISEPGHHLITVTVRDPDFFKSMSIEVIVEPREVIGPNGGDEPDEPSDSTNWALYIGVLVVLIVVGAVLFMVATKRRGGHIEEEEEEQVVLEDQVVEEDLPEPSGTQEEEAPQEIEMTGTTGAGLSMQATVSEGASHEVQELFGAAEAAEPVMSEKEQEQLRLDNLKRKYQNAIGRLPYGIPSPELAERDWVDLAAALATGDKKETPQGQEITQIDGRWYYSDVKDTGTFLKEHGAKKERKEATKATPTADKTALLAKLEERFILGEISEQAYKALREKYEE